MSNIQRITEKPIFDLLQPKQADIIRFIGVDRFKKEVSFAIQAANGNDMLMQATPASVAKSIFNVAITGLSLNPVHKLAYLVPKRIAGVWEAVLFPSYQGLVKLITDSGSVRRIEAHVVYEGDHLEYEYGLDPKLIHRPARKSQDISAVYAIAILQDGSKQFEVMSAQEIDDIMNRSDSGKKGIGPWKTDKPEMARKTVIRRIFKYLPKTDRFEQVAEAIALDEQDYPATMGQIGFIEGLLSSANIDPEEQSRITRSLDAMTADDAGRMIEYLQDNQLNPVTHMGKFSAGEAAAQIATIVQDDDDEEMKRLNAEQQKLFEEKKK